MKIQKDKEKKRLIILPISFTDKSYDKIKQKNPEQWKENLEISNVKCRRCRLDGFLQNYFIYDLRREMFFKLTNRIDDCW